MLKDIPGYAGKYAITEDGMVWAHPSDRNKRGRPHNGIWMKPTMKSNGYLEICLRKPGESKYLMVHRLMALTFLEKVEGKTIVNHKDGVKTNNHIDNIEWCTMLENIRHARDVLGAYKGKRNGRYVHGRNCKTYA